MLVGDDQRRAVMDAMQYVLGPSAKARVVVMPVDAV